MFALAISFLTLRLVHAEYVPLGDLLCFDLELGDPDMAFVIEDDEVEEETGDHICAWHLGYHIDLTCRRDGIERDEKSKTDDCWKFPRRTFVKDKPFYIVSYGYDAAWVDRFEVCRYNGWDCEWDRTYGQNDNHGWCISNDRNDHLDWNHDDRPQHVPDNQCYFALRLDPNGSVWGYHWGHQRLCREQRTMDCKDGCPGGWKHIGTEGHGCCTGWAFWKSCGGNKKICANDTPCRRRQAVEGVEPLFEDGNWELLQAPPADEAETATRRLAAMEDLVNEAVEME